MRIDGELRLHAAEDAARLLRRRVVGDHALALLFRKRRRRSGPFRIGSDHLVDQDVGAAGELHEVVVGARVSREHDGTASRVDAIPVCRANHAMIDEERGDLKGSLRDDGAVRDLDGNEARAFGGTLLVEVAPHVDVEGVGPLEIAAEIRRPRRPPDAQGHRPPEDPAREPQIRNPDGVIRVEVREKQRVRLREAPEREEPLRRAPPRVEEKRSPLAFDEDRRPASDLRAGIPRSQERHRERCRSRAVSERQSREHERDRRPDDAVHRPPRARASDR
jgi:hypothetical protein